MEERKRILRGEERKEEEDMKERWRPWYLTSIMNAFIKPVAVYNEYTPIKEINVRKKSQFSSPLSNNTILLEDMLAASIYKQKATSM